MQMEPQSPVHWGREPAAGTDPEQWRDVIGRDYIGRLQHSGGPTDTGGLKTAQNSNYMINI